jgi:hypothetical protein
MIRVHPEHRPRHVSHCSLVKNKDNMSSSLIVTNELNKKNLLLDGTL